MLIKMQYIAYSLMLIIGLFQSSVNAQVQIPDASPKCTVVQKIGLSDIRLEYSRPSMRNRMIFGDLIPYDRMWRTGQNEATTIEFSDDVLVEGDLLPKGKYALYTIPGEDTWEIIFYKDWDHFGMPKRYNDHDEVLRVTVESDLLSMTFETLLINFDKLTDASTTLQIFWEDAFVEVNLEFDTDSKVQSNIEMVMSGPSRSDYYLAAKYYYDHGQNLEKSLDWVNMSNEIAEKYWQYRLKSQILLKLEEEDDALDAAERSLELSKKARNSKYIRYNEEFIDQLTGGDDEVDEMEGDVINTSKINVKEKSISKKVPNAKKKRPRTIAPKRSVDEPSMDDQ